MEVEIGRGKKGRRAYGFDDIAIVPSRRTRDPDDVDISWTLGPYRFELPLLASAMDGVVSPRTAIELGRHGGLGVLNLEGIWSRYEVTIEQLEPVTTVGSGDCFLAGYVAARFEGASARDCLAFGVACGAESTQHFGAGTLDRREVERLLPRVQVSELEPAAVR